MKRFTTLMAAAALTLGGYSTADAKKVHTIGDSTMANYDENATVTRGWCQYLQQFLDGIEVNNRGKNGASSKSFYQESAYWTSVKKQMAEGDYVLIQFAHNDEKTQGMDGDEVKAYYTSQGNTTQANATDYRGTCPNTTYKEYLRKYVSETRAAGCTPILVGSVCRMYFSGNTIRRNGRHDLGDSFSVVSSDGIKTGRSVAASDHSMDYTYQMKLVAEEMNVPFVDLTTATADLFLSYGDKDCHAILGDGDGSTHLSATGAALIARRFVQLCQEQGLLTEYAHLTSELSITPDNADLGSGYKGQSMTKEFMVTGFDLSPASGNVSIISDGNIMLSTDQQTWEKNLSVAYNGGTLIQRFYAQMSIDEEGVNSASINVKAGNKSLYIPVTVTGVQLSGGTEVSAYWRLESDDNCVTEGPVTVIPESWHGMTLQKYANPNANTVWPSYTGFDASRKTQRNVIEGEKWPAGEIDEVSTRYIEFGITAPAETVINIDEISYYTCGCGGNGMCVHVWYSTEDDFSNATLIFSMSKMPANNMQDGKIQPVIKLNEGKSLRLRFYPWYNGEANGKTLCISDVKFHGYAMAAEDPAGITDVAADAESVIASTYYTIQGMAVNTPVAGNVYIKCDLHADGSMTSSKIRY